MQSGAGAAKAPVSAAAARTEGTIIPLAGIRKIIAERMKFSLDTMAPANHRMDVDMTELLALRKKLNEFYEKQGVKISIMDLLIKITARALKDFPMVNSSMVPEGILLHDAVNMGIAVAVDKGLVVPALKNAHLKTLPEISAASKELIDKARNGKLSPDEMSGGTFTITNLGMYDVDSFTPIINPPEAGILGVGKINDRAVVESGVICIRPITTLSLTFDHRIVDGAPAADFLKAIKAKLQNPLSLM
jgi:pyruvate dehydrogenase E2 component (dihydrolipoamide acetyltransferase)